MRRTAVQDERNGLVLGMHRVRRGAKTGVVDGRCIGWFCRTAVAATDCLAGGVRRNRADPAPDGRVRQVGVTHGQSARCQLLDHRGQKVSLGEREVRIPSGPHGGGEVGFRSAKTSAAGTGECSVLTRTTSARVAGAFRARAPRLDGVLGGRTLCATGSHSGVNPPVRDNGSAGFPRTKC